MISLNIGWKPSIPPPHVHVWENHKDTDISTDAAILWALTGYVCKCGAKAIYEGPVRGMRIIGGGI